MNKSVFDIEIDKGINMKKIILLFLFITGLNFSSMKAQSETFDETGFNIGINAGINESSIFHEQTYSLTRLMPFAFSIKFAAGALIGYNFSENAGIAIGISTAGAGENYSDAEGGITYTKSVKLNYMQVPILFKYMDGEGSNHYYAMGGPQLMFLSNSSMSISNDKFQTKIPNYVDGTNITPDMIPISPKSTAGSLFQKTDIGFRLEVGEDFSLSDNIYLNAGLDAYIGFTDINIPDMRTTFRFGGETYSYKASQNFIGGIVAGIHYILK